jgi:hypothetical protein
MFTNTETELANIWQDSYKVQVDPVNDYRVMFNLAPLTYWESFNYVKYGQDQHFSSSFRSRIFIYMCFIFSRISK